ncbi:toxin secretion, membrane fusion protein [Ancylothrix sp. C2]|uniref:toxin secretion, membrane fusion protein n=1 Tax=Ancylothrix sp. D3o TaxID=2953691 RepID=UPI0021BBA491|nr:toxin secretion, membrane fusion protein [Ancylothrix sp. D3o]MCT7953426.1 toxin secretion, membrane fusion protein [Ancylothrix sp. D3o]
MEKVICKTTNKKQTNDFQYWQSQPPLKRLEALEQIRQEYHQYKYNTEPRLQRVYTIIRRGQEDEHRQR